LRVRKGDGKGFSSCRGVILGKETAVCERKKLFWEEKGGEGSVFTNRRKKEKTHCLRNGRKGDVLPRGEISGKERKK